MEDNEGNQEKEILNLGKLQYSLDYDFQKGEVNIFNYISQNFIFIQFAYYQI